MLPMLTLLADTGISLPDLGPAIASIGSIGISSWHVYYTTTVTIPKLLQSHADERTEMQKRHDTAIHELLSEMKEQRQQFAAWMTKPRADMSV